MDSVPTEPDADETLSAADQLASEGGLHDETFPDSKRRSPEGRSTAQRESNTAERAATAVLRAQSAKERLDLADRRDEASRLRDLAAAARDRSADARDELLAETEPAGPGTDARAQAAAERARAAVDRERAAADREQAAIDRQHVRDALSQAHLDELTGTYRRGLGTLELEREVNRSRHSGGRLVLAFVDVDGLKAVNDSDGHAAGDALLVDVAATIRSKLRSYDPVVRFGGDEFICAFSEFGMQEARTRFVDIQTALTARQPGSSISVGFAELEGAETLDDLMARGDADLYQAKRRRDAAA